MAGFTMNLYAAVVIRNAISDYISNGDWSFFNLDVKKIDKLFDNFGTIDSAVKKKLGEQCIDGGLLIEEVLETKYLMNKKIDITKALILDKILSGKFDEAQSLCAVLIQQELKLNNLSIALLDVLSSKEIETPGIG